MTALVLIFDSNAGTMIATKALRDCGVPARMIPTPAGVQSLANLSLSIDDAMETQALTALRTAKIAPSAVHR
jgi:hypothetical protein